MLEASSVLSVSASSGWALQPGVGNGVVGSAVVTGAESEVSDVVVVVVVVGRDEEEG